MNPLKAIRAKCLDCSGGSASQVRQCTALTCDLHQFRFGTNPTRKRRTIAPDHLAALPGWWKWSGERNAFYQRQRMTKKVYVICEDHAGVPMSPVKIGYSSNPNARVRQLQSGNGRRLRVHKVFEIPAGLAEIVERQFHQTHPEARLCGEWFEMHPDTAVICVRMAALFIMGQPR